jgi:outer membrane receptor for ferrienterochelin and colicin
MNQHRRIRTSKLALGLVAALAAAPTFAQSTSAGVGGTVTSAAGTPVAGAEVTITHVESGTTSRATTDASGRYVARGLRVGGPYTIVINSADGTTTRDGVYLNLDKVNQVDAELTGNIATLGSVQAIGTNYGSAIFSANKMGTGTNVTREEIESLPSINRNLQDYVRLDPRVSQTDKSRNEISVGGQNPRFNAIRVDGIATNDAFGLESNGLPTPRQPFSMDVIDEISVDVANYDVTITGATGGVINAVTKSGTNEFHGSVYGTYRDNDWSGKNQNDIRPVLFDNEKTYGLTVGGPIVKDKLFFFANYEKYEGKGLFSGTSGYGPRGSGASNEVTAITQADIDRIIAISRDTYGFDAGSLTLPALNSESEEKGLKIDWNISDNHRASFRYGETDQSTANLNGFGNTSLSLNSYHYVRDFSLKTYTGQLFSDWSDSFSTEAKVSYRDYSAVRTPASLLPAIAVRVGTGTVNLGTEQSSQANELGTETWNAFFAANLYLNDHTLKFGFDYEDNDIFNLFAQRVFGSYSFNSIDDYAANRPLNYRYSDSNTGSINDIAAQWGMRNVGLFVQDSWAVNNNLTLTFGLRYDEPMVKNSPAYNEAASNAFGRRNDQTIDGNGLFQPRFGFNYTFDSDRPTQVRGGVGLFQGAAASVWLSNPYSNTGLAYTDYNFSSQALVNSNGILFTPDINNQPTGVPGAVSGATQSVDFVDGSLGQPSIWKANLAFDTELPWYGIVASVEAVATKINEAIYYQQLNLGDATATAQDGRSIYWNAAGLNPLCWNSAGTPLSGASAPNACVTSNAARASLTDPRSGRNRAYNDAIIARSTDGGGSQSVTVGLSKPFNDGDWSWSLAYTFTDAEEVSTLTSSTSSSQLTNTAVYQANEAVKATSSYEIRNSFLGTLQWKHAFFGDYNTKLGLIYQGRSGRPYSYAFDNDANGDGRLNDLLYIPAGRGDVVFRNAAEENAFWDYVASDEYLRTHQGQVAQRNGARNRWVNQFDLHIEQEIPGFMKGHKGQIWLDVMNVGNLINKDWGRIEEVGFPGMKGVVEYGGIDAATGKYVYRFNSPDTANIYDDRGISRWSLQLGFRYQF